jgi:hypothetical protein
MEYNTRSVRMLKIEDVIGVWDLTGFMGKLWRVRGEMDEVVREFEGCVDGGDESLKWRALKPKLGSMIKVSNIYKMRAYMHCITEFSSFFSCRKMLKEGIVITLYHIFKHRQPFGLKRNMMVNVHRFTSKYLKMMMV